MDWLEKNLPNSVPKQVLLIDSVLLIWIVATTLYYKSLPATLLAAIATGGAIVLLAFLSGVLLYLFLPWGLPVYLFKLHRDFYLNYVPTKRNKARWVINALKKGGPQ